MCTAAGFKKRSATTPDFAYGSKMPKPMRNPDPELRRYTEQQRERQRAEYRASRVEFYAEKAAAKAVLPALLADTEHIARFCAKTGHSPAKLRKELDYRAKWQPSIILRLAAEWGHIA